MLEKIQYEEGLPIKVQVLEIQHYPWHMHEDIQIIYVMEGELELKMTYTRYRLAKNSMHIIHSDDIHGFKSLSKNNLVVVLSFNMEYFSEFYPDLDTQVFSTKVSEDVATYKKQLAMKTHIFSIISEFYGKGKGYKGRIKELSMELMSTLYKDFRGFSVDLEKRTFEHKVSHDMLQIDRISRVVSFVYQNYPYKLSLAAIAEKENINNYYLSHLFQRLVGDSFRNFVSMVRVEMSEAELLTTESSIAQISQNVGFSNAKYYVENFKEWFGCHPKEYRQLYKDEVAGRAIAKVKELPLDSINDVIESYGEFPAFTGASSDIKSVGFDLRIAEKKSRTFRTQAVEPKGFYKDYDPQLDCLKLLKELFQAPAAAPAIPILSDTRGFRSGTLTINGMRKPLHYLNQFLSRQSELIGKCDSWYMITTNEQDVELLFFNEDPDKSQDFEFNFFKMPGNYQITEYRLSSAATCIAFWKQLNFKSPLSHQEKQQIQAMSAPRISFQTIFSSGSFTYSAELEPFEILFVEIRKV